MKVSDLIGPDAPATITVEQAATVLGVSRGTAYEGARSGQLPILSLGRRRLVPVARLLAMLGVGEEGVADPDGAARLTVVEEPA